MIRDPVISFFRDFDRIVESFINSPDVTFSPLPWKGEGFPPYDVLLHEKEIIYRFALAGYRKDEIEIIFEGNRLVVSGRKTEDAKKEGTEEIKEKVMHNGIRKGHFQFSVYYPAANYLSDQAHATFINGILEVVIPIKEEKLPKRLEITA